mgnify:CR=1 FL=1
MFRPTHLVRAVQPSSLEPARPLPVSAIAQCVDALCLHEHTVWSSVYAQYTKSRSVGMAHGACTHSPVVLVVECTILVTVFPVYAVQPHTHPLPYPCTQRCSTPTFTPAPSTPPDQVIDFYAAITGGLFGLRPEFAVILSILFMGLQHVQLEAVWRNSLVHTPHAPHPLHCAAAPAAPSEAAL